MPIGADPQHRQRRLRDHARHPRRLGVNMTVGAGQHLVRHAGPARHQLDLLADGDDDGLTSRIMDARTPQIIDAVKAADVVMGNDQWGMATGSRVPCEAGRRGGSRRTAANSLMTRSSRAVHGARVSSLPTAEYAGQSPSGHDGTGRVKLNFAPAEREVRVPPASRSSMRRAGTASRSTRRAAATAPARSARSDPRRHGAGLAASTSARSGRRARRGLAAGLPGLRRTPTSRSSSPADHPPQGRDGRRRAAGHPATGDPEALRRADEPSLHDQLPDVDATAGGDRRPRAQGRPARAAPATVGHPRGGLEVHRRHRR